MSRWLFEWHALMSAIQFLTRIPVPGGMHQPGADLAILQHSIIYYPLVGGLLAFLTGTVYGLACFVWIPLVAALLALAFEAFTTGGFHEDAVADSCDAFGGGWTRDDILRILKDSRVGSYGALGLILAIGLRASLISSLVVTPEKLLLVVALVASSGAIGRWTILVMRTLYPLVSGRDGLSKDIAGDVRPGMFLAGTLWLLPTLIFMFTVTLTTAADQWEVITISVKLAAAVSLSAICGWLWGRYAVQKIGGLTGDVLGCGCYLGQIMTLLVLTASIPR